MPKEARTNSELIKEYITLYPKEFYQSSLGQLWCRFCNKSVTYSRKSLVDSHRNTKKHLNYLVSNLGTSQDPLILLSKAHFTEDLVSLFLSVDIPLNKLRYQNFQDFLTTYELPNVSQSTAQRQVKRIAETKLIEIRVKLVNNKIYLIIDESSFRNRYIVNILMGSLHKPNDSFLVSSEVLSKPTNAGTITRLIDDAVIKFGIRRENFLLLLSDAAAYNMLAAINLKNLFPKLTHVTCLLHLLHNCCYKVKTNFGNIDKLISSLKAATIKNRERRADFTDIPIPPQPILTRWGSWLRALSYYKRHFNNIKDIVNNWEIKGKLTRDCKDIVNHSGLKVEIELAFECYNCLTFAIEELEQKKHNISSAFYLIRCLDFGEDPAHVQAYLEKRLRKNEIEKICMEEGPLHDSYGTRDLLLNAQPTSIDVERSFSLLNVLLEDNRIFSDDNIADYIICYYNK
eukprot:GAHX01001217.1.p1 GENE.GAHX01001217.1~~GAHX01001217.1.p1  ORF type:complete len:457 (-),score=48.95 GAHX01001217.1:118-1488(-)